MMVRDDFWMAATRFMRDLEIRLVEGQNSAAVDLFDLDHARKVLGGIRSGLRQASRERRRSPREQKDFLKQSVLAWPKKAKSSPSAWRCLPR